MPVPTDNEIKECMLSTAGAAFGVAQAGENSDITRLSDLTVEQLELALRRSRKWCRGLYLQTMIRGKSEEEIAEAFSSVKDGVEEVTDINNPLQDGAVKNFREEGKDAFNEDEDADFPSVDTPRLATNLRRALREVETADEREELREAVAEAGSPEVDTDLVDEGDTDTQDDTDTEDSDTEDLDTTGRGDARLGNFGN